jgi:hypothetical protein
VPRSATKPLSSSTSIKMPNLKLIYFDLPGSECQSRRSCAFVWNLSNLEGPPQCHEASQAAAVAGTKPVCCTG